MTADELASELAATIRELGEARVHAVRARADGWRSTTHLSVTERREEIRCLTADMDTEVIRLEADVEALRVELDAELRKIEAVKYAELIGRP